MATDYLTENWASSGRYLHFLPVSLSSPTGCGCPGSVRRLQGVPLWRVAGAAPCRTWPVPAGSNGPAAGHGPALQPPRRCLGRAGVRQGKTQDGTTHRTARSEEEHFLPFPPKWKCRYFSDKHSVYGCLKLLKLLKLDELGLNLEGLSPTPLITLVRNTQPQPAMHLC